MWKRIVGFVTSSLSRFLRPGTAEPEPEAPAPPRLIAEVIADAPLVSDREVEEAIRQRLPAMQRRFQAAVGERLGSGFEVKPLVLEAGSLELIAPIFSTLAMTVSQYGGIRQGLSYLADDLASIFGIELRRAGGKDELVDGYWRPTAAWSPAPDATDGNASAGAGASDTRLRATWKPGTGIIDVAARMTELSADDRVLLSVRRREGKTFRRRLYGASWAPDALGVVDESLQIEADPRGGSVCVIMRLLRGTYARGSESLLRRGPCTARSRGTAVFLGTPERTT
jgi:hypothetical protein